jgi:hypothetical protein
MWRRSRDHRTRGQGGAGDPVGERLGETLGDECEAFLAGQLAAYLLDAGRPIPTYAWFNQVVHATETELMVIAAGSPDTLQPLAWRRTVARLARTMLERSEETGRHVAELQCQLLLPLELELAGDPDRAGLEAGDLLRLALCRLFEFPGTPAL